MATFTTKTRDEVQNGEKSHDVVLPLGTNVHEISISRSLNENILTSYYTNHNRLNYRDSLRLAVFFNFIRFLKPCL